MHLFSLVYSPVRVTYFMISAVLRSIRRVSRVHHRRLELLNPCVDLDLTLPFDRPKLSGPTGTRREESVLFSTTQSPELTAVAPIP